MAEFPFDVWGEVRGAAAAGDIKEEVEADLHLLLDVEWPFAPTGPD
ncbi:MAG: hypothetical protein M3Y87_24125 [Myxococcota bacterium]|nr:hypothetical protein [Myxococcota bacterium]